MSYRNDVDALAARHDALAVEVAAKTRELESAAQLLEEAKQRAKLPVLPNIRVATPCRADWNQMTGDDRVRACASCNKNVYNLSSMTRDEAESLIVAKEGKLCVRYFQRADGTILLKDCAVGVAQKRKRRVIAVGAAALLGGGVFLALHKDQKKEAIMGAMPEPMQGGAVFVEPPPPPPPSQQVYETMGDVAVEPMLGEVAVEPVKEIKGKIAIE
jgi:hypothetical protein